jgi:hypothetical protein
MTSANDEADGAVLRTGAVWFWAVETALIFMVASFLFWHDVYHAACAPFPSTAAMVPAPAGTMAA